MEYKQKTSLKLLTIYKRKIIISYINIKKTLRYPSIKNSLLFTMNMSILEIIYFSHFMKLTKNIIIIGKVVNIYIKNNRYELKFYHFIGKVNIILH